MRRHACITGGNEQCAHPDRQYKKDTHKDKDGISKECQLKLDSSNDGGGGGAANANPGSIVASESCRLCGKNVANIKKHMKSHFPDKYQCHICMISLTRSDNLKRHIKLKHGIRDGSASSHSAAAAAAASFLGSSLMRGLDTKHFLAKSDPAFLT